jgi:chromosome segregation ATPase
VQGSLDDEDTISALEEKQRKSESLEADLRQSISKLKAEVFQLRDENSVKDAQISSLMETSTAHENRASYLEDRLTLERCRIEDMKKAMADASLSLKAKQKQIQDLAQNCDEQGRLLSEKDREINSLKEQAQSAQMDQLKDSPEFIDLMTEYYFSGFMSLKKKISLIC